MPPLYRDPTNGRLWRELEDGTPQWLDERQPPTVVLSAQAEPWPLQTGRLPLVLSLPGSLPAGPRHRPLHRKPGPASWSWRVVLLPLVPLGVLAAVAVVLLIPFG